MRKARPNSITFRDIDEERPEAVYMEQFGVRYLCIPVQKLPAALAGLLLSAAFETALPPKEEH